MRHRFALAALVLAGTCSTGAAQPGAIVFDRDGGKTVTPNGSTTVFHGTSGPVGLATGEGSAGSSAPPQNTVNSTGTTVFHGTPAAPPNPTSGAGR